MYALVSGSQLIRLTQQTSFSWNNMSYSQVNLMTHEERAAHGIYSFTPAVHNVPVGFKPGAVSYMVDDATGTVVEVIDNIPLTADELVIKFGEAKEKQIAAIGEACGAAIAAGFDCSALGTMQHYPLKDKDQANLGSSVLSSLMPGIDTATWTTPFVCMDLAGAWEYRNHTAQQIQQVGVEAKAFVQSKLLANDAKRKAIEAIAQSSDHAADIAAVEAIVW